MENLLKMRLLLVDDDTLSVSLMKGILEKAGYKNLATASSIEKALKMIMTTPPDLVIVDFLIPGMDGLGLCKTIKENPSTADIAVFVVTGTELDYSELVKEAFKSGASECITKPFKAADFLARLRSALRTRQLISQLREEIVARAKAELEQKHLIEELQKALASINTLKGLLPICSSCKKIRDDKGYWKSVEKYLSEISGTEFTHGICPECARKLYPRFYKKGKTAEPDDREQGS